MSNYEFTADFNKFDISATKYNGENGLVLADCARLAYENKDTIENAMNTWKFTKIAFFGFEEQKAEKDKKDKKSTQAFIASNKETIIIAFRGTQEPKDFVMDAKFALTNTLYGKVHHGFYKGLNEVWEEMFKTIESVRDNNQSIWFCGHSLGAALATLAVAEYVLVKNKTINGLYTIGQPRTGNNVFSNNFNAKLKNKCFRFINNADIVTRNPVPELILKYRHIGIPLYINGDDELEGSITLMQKTNDINTSMVKGLVKYHKFENFDDHKSEKYVELILKNRSKLFDF